jgi:hypothetical protein
LKQSATVSSSGSTVFCSSLAIREEARKFKIVRGNEKLRASDLPFSFGLVLLEEVFSNDRINLENVIAVQAGNRVVYVDQRF